MNNLEKELHELKQALVELHQRELQECSKLFKEAKKWNSLSEKEKDQLVDTIEKCEEKYNSIKDRIENAIEKTTQLISNTTKNKN